MKLRSGCRSVLNLNLVWSVVFIRLLQYFEVDLLCPPVLRHRVCCVWLHFKWDSGTGSITTRQPQQADHQNLLHQDPAGCSRGPAADVSVPQFLSFSWSRSLLSFGSQMKCRVLLGDDIEWSIKLFVLKFCEHKLHRTTYVPIVKNSLRHLCLCFFCIIFCTRLFLRSAGTSASRATPCWTSGCHFRATWRWTTIHSHIHTDGPFRFSSGRKLEKRTWRLWKERSQD